MKKFLYPLGTLAATLTMFFVAAAPAQAEVLVAPGPISIGYTNTDHTRVGVMDLAADGRWARLDVKYAGAWHIGWVYDDSDAEGDGAPAPLVRPYRIRACTEGLGCGHDVLVN